MTPDQWAIIGIVFAWLMREVIPPYLRSKRGDDIATKADILHLEQRVTSLEVTMREVRDWTIVQQAKERK